MRRKKLIAWRQVPCLGCRLPPYLNPGYALAPALQIKHLFQTFILPF
jgi:hypothetical protein